MDQIGKGLLGAAVCAKEYWRLQLTVVIGQKFYKIEVEALQLSLQQLKKKTLTKTFIKGTNKPQKGPF